MESYQVLLWFDAFGLALVSVAGAVKASDVGVPALVAIAMGAVTGVVGGIVRDTLGHVLRCFSAARSTSQRRCSVPARTSASTAWASIGRRR